MAGLVTFLLFDTADRAARDARLRPGSAVAVVVAMEAEHALHSFRGRVDLDPQEEVGPGAGR